MQNNLLIVHQNIRSLRANFDVFLAELATVNLKPDIIILSEIWINRNEINFYNMLNYKAYFKCNEQHRAGGVAVYVKESIANVECNELQSQCADLLLISFEFSGKTFSLLAIYRLHSYSAEVFVRELNGCFNNINDKLKNIKNLLWIGDVNISIIDNKHFISATDEYIALLSMYGLEKVLNEPTMLTEQSKTYRDHVFVRLFDKSVVNVEETIQHLGITDHSFVQVDVCVKSGGGGSRTADKSAPLFYPRYRTDYALLEQLLGGTDWSCVYSQPDASSAFDRFFDIVNGCLSECKVEIKESCTTHLKLKPWINENICLKIKKRQHLFKQVKAHPKNDNLNNYYRRFRNNLNDDIRNSKENYYRKQFEKCKGSSKSTLQLLNKLTSQSEQKEKQIEIEIDRVTIDEPLIVANKFNSLT